MSGLGRGGLEEEAIKIASEKPLIFIKHLLHYRNNIWKILYIYAV